MKLSTTPLLSTTSQEIWERHGLAVGPTSTSRASRNAVLAGRVAVDDLEQSRIGKISSTAIVSRDCGGAVNLFDGHSFKREND